MFASERPKGSQARPKPHKAPSERIECYFPTHDSLFRNSLASDNDASPSQASPGHDRTAAQNRSVVATKPPVAGPI